MNAFEYSKSQETLTNGSNIFVIDTREKFVINESLHYSLLELYDDLMSRREHLQYTSANLGKRQNNDERYPVIFFADKWRCLDCLIETPIFKYRTDQESGYPWGIEFTEHGKEICKLIKTR